MNIFDWMGMAISEAANNMQDCPVCGSPVSPEPASGDADGTYSYAHECDCWLEAASASDGFGNDIDISKFEDEFRQFSERKDKYLPSFYLFSLQKVYKKHCYNCKTPGVDSELNECEEDPPYKYKCINCDLSLRQHSLFGEGKIYDMAKFKETWHFDENRKPASIPNFKRY